jgi:hypothetical protein
MVDVFPKHPSLIADISFFALGEVCSWQTFQARSSLMLHLNCPKERHFAQKVKGG